MTNLLTHRHHILHGGNIFRATILTLLLFITSVSAASLSLAQPSNNGVEGRERRSGLRALLIINDRNKMASHNRQKGPGSSPPTCRSKCGRCNPCTPVHVPIHPGMSLALEYYPEAWRCKCGNKLFMP